MHRFTKDDAQRRLAAASKATCARSRYVEEAAALEGPGGEYETLLAVALANQGMPLSCLDSAHTAHGRH